LLIHQIEVRFIDGLSGSARLIRRFIDTEAAFELVPAKGPCARG
jgi:hypothetical protein